MTLTTITETFREDEIENDLYGPYYEVDTLPDNVFEVKVVETILESITAHTIQNTN